MYMRFGNILNELLMEYESGVPFKSDGDLTLSVADDSLDYFVMTVQSEKYKKILGTFTIFRTVENDGEGNYVRSDAVITHKFEKVPNKETMYRALGLYADAIWIYLSHIKNLGEEVPYPTTIYFEGKSPIEKRLFKSGDYDHHLYVELYAKHGRDRNENPLANYWRNGDNGHWMFKFH
jgi:hypothetical protein